MPAPGQTLTPPESHTVPRHRRLLKSVGARLTEIDLAPD